MSVLEQFIDDATLVASAPSLPVLPFCFGAKAKVFPDDAAVANFEKSDWSPSLSSTLYRVDGWGPPYFSVSSSGNISILPHGKETMPSQEIDLLEITKKVTEPVSSGGLGLCPPFIVRFPEMLKHRLESLQSAFDSAIASQVYGATYQGVFPVKCNQDRFIIEDIVKFGSPFRFGLEAGSKPELLLAMHCLCKGSSEALLVCNGFKDSEYISLALIARKLAFNTVVVFEQEEELDLVIELSKKLDIRPVVGVRAKLRTRHSGHYGSTSGERGQFGLTTTQILRIVKKLEQEGMLDCLQLLHFHIGSQIPTTAVVADGVSEAAQIYCELVRLGANMRVVDIGGGLGIDYDGSKASNSDVSVSYTLEEYTETVVKTLRSICDKRSITHPVISSESGRATVSHHTVLIFEVFNSSSRDSNAAESSLLEQQRFLDGLQADARAEYMNLFSAAMRGDNNTCLLHANQLKQHCIRRFKQGALSIEQLAEVDGLHLKVSKAASEPSSLPVHTYRMNLSIFTSIPNYWGTGHLFPIMPIHRLDQRPTMRGMLSDLTCDSDGKLATYIGGESSLPLHELDGNKNGHYYLGLFLGGAYEEAQGQIHNLFGAPNVVRVESEADNPGGFIMTRALLGPNCGDLLRVMRHEPKAMVEAFRHRAEELGAVGGDQDGLATEALAGGLAHFFSSWPYLVSTST
ncbi:arginine decarboxylase-like [Punica granatum]|uniref:Arginine decarboxylase n=1 Tax=Punica granatum TaxID=22663 RepID=A0A6P8C914_PUNGR|nr:arginine decarboxylase-like [Punica granatum]